MIRLGIGAAALFAALLAYYATVSVERVKHAQCQIMAAHNAAVEWCYRDDYVCAPTVEDWSQYHINEAKIARMCEEAE